MMSVRISPSERGAPRGANRMHLGNEGDCGRRADRCSHPRPVSGGSLRSRPSAVACWSEKFAGSDSHSCKPPGVGAERLPMRSADRRERPSPDRYCSRMNLPRPGGCASGCKVCQRRAFGRKRCARRWPGCRVPERLDEGDAVAEPIVRHEVRNPRLSARAENRRMSGQPAACSRAPGSTSFSTCCADLVAASASLPTRSGCSAPGPSMPLPPLARRIRSWVRRW